MLRSAEFQLANLAGRAYCRMTSRGSSAIYVALKVIGEIKGFGEVIVPAIGCLSIPQAVQLAGHKPVFADINPNTGCLSVEDTEKRAVSQTKAILPVHIFGHAAEISQICNLAARLGAAVVEDSCHALGGQADGKKIGSWGMFSVASFGGTKSLGGLGGGALLFDDDRLIPYVEDELAKLPLSPEKGVVDLLALSHRNLYHGVVDYRRATGLQAKSLTVGHTADQYRPLLISGDPVSSEALQAIIAGIKCYDNSNYQRLQAARSYDQALSQSPCRRVPIDFLENTGTLWRYTFTCSTASQAKVLTSMLRKAGLQASNHYWSLSEIWASNNDLKSAAWFQERVINLWVDQSATLDYLTHTNHVISDWIQKSAPHMERT